MKYHATVKSLNAHKKVCLDKKSGRKQGHQATLLIDGESSDEEFESENEQFEANSKRPKFSVAMPDSFVEKILDLKEWLKSPWEEV